MCSYVLVRVLFDGANECIHYISFNQSSCSKSFISTWKKINNFFHAFRCVCRYEKWTKLCTIWNGKLRTMCGFRQISHNFNNQWRNKQNGIQNILWFMLNFQKERLFVLSLRERKITNSAHFKTCWSLMLCVYYYCKGSETTYKTDEEQLNFFWTIAERVRYMYTTIF